MQAEKSQRSPEPRSRLIGGLLGVLPGKGYAKVTIADIVRGAGVSKRTFYEHFDDKEACFLTAYQLLSDRTLAAVAAAADPAEPWEQQVAAAVRSYVEFLGVSPELSRVFMNEVYAAGPRAVAAQRETHARFAKLIRELVARGREQNPTLKPLSAAMAIAVVGGINELVLVALHRPEADLRAVIPTIAQLLSAVLADVA